MLLLSSKGKKPFVNPKHVYEPVIDKYIFMVAYPDLWKLNPACDENNPKSHELMIPCADLNCDKMTFSHVNTRQNILLFIRACAHFNYCTHFKRKIMWRRATNAKSIINLTRLDLTHVPKILGIIEQSWRLWSALKPENIKELEIGHKNPIIDVANV